MTAPKTISEALAAAGWTPHDGGECPVAENTILSMLDADGYLVTELARDAQWVWNSDKPGDNVIAYSTSMS